MCGIMGYTGFEQASPIILEGLSRLEYRGYDSAGLAVQSPSPAEDVSPLQVVKVRGRIQSLSEQTDHGASLPGFCGIGHTRWATHGIPSVENAHPHVSEDGRIAVVHNGIIENYEELRRQLKSENTHFSSQTDTEVIVHLLAKALCAEPWLSKQQLIGRMLRKLRGTLALGLLFADEPGTLYAVRRNSPLIIGCIHKDNNAFSGVISSDVHALLPLTKKVYYPKDHHIIKLTTQGISFYAYDDVADRITDITSQYGEPKTLTLSEADIHMGSFKHYMRKEIQEAPQAVKRTLQSGLFDSQNPILPPNFFCTDIQRIQMVACGSAYHACLVGKYAIESLCRIPVDVDIASEFRYRDLLLSAPRHTLAVFVSQSGETADTLAALRHCRAQGVPTLGIVNVQGSSLAIEADHVFFTQAGPEIAVATTKAYCAQVAAMYLLALQLGSVQTSISEKAHLKLSKELLSLPEHMATLLESEPSLIRLANTLSHTEHIFFIGRGMDHALSMEGSLKLKEVSYIHAEAYAAGELKHGTISLIENGTPVIALATQPHLTSKTLSNIAEVKARGAYVICLAADCVSSTNETARGDSFPSHDPLAVSAVADEVISLPAVHPCFMPLLSAIPLQLLAYHVSVQRALDPDKPRNLAKSVTVE